MTRLDPNHPAVKAAKAQAKREGRKSATDAFRVGDDIVVTEEQGLLLWQIKAEGLGDAVPEFRFDPVRKWRFDVALPDLRLAIEVEGGIWTNGAHTRGGHFESDTEKYAEAAIAGWTVLRASTQQVKDGKAIDWVRRWIEARDV